MLKYMVVYGLSAIGIFVKIVESKVFDYTPSEYCNSFVVYNMLCMLSYSLFQLEAVEWS